MKYFVSAISFLLLFTLFSITPVSAIECRHDACGAAAGCPEGQRCSDPSNSPFEGKCYADSFCENADQRYNVECGDGSTDGMCGPQSGCAEGFMCRDTYVPWDARCIPKPENASSPSCASQVGNTTPVAGDPDATGGDEDTTPTVNVFEGPNAQNFSDLNPLRMFGNADSQKLNSPGGIVSRMLQFAFPLAGLILFAMLVWGGFEMIIGATSKGIDAGRQRITNALIGFTLLFVSYWIFQIVEFIFGVVIL